ncbi:hypothetical protein PINS_up001541 [Pythium insidiosum]|nr:hypothetical protein PINS_up001541 [Pythium insidiosum]
MMFPCICVGTLCCVSTSTRCCADVVTGSSAARWKSCASSCWIKRVLSWIRSQSRQVGAPGSCALWVSSDVDTGSRSDRMSDEPLPLLAIQEAFRSTVVALTAAPITYSATQRGDRKPETFRLLSYTLEDATQAGTMVDPDTPANSWIYADQSWIDEEEKKQEEEPEILPVRSIRGDAIPFTLQVYLEKR